MQQSLSTISGVLGFAEHSEVPLKPTTTSGLPTMPSLPETNWRSNGLFMTENEAIDADVQQQNVTPAVGDDKISSPEMGAASPYRSLSRPMSPRTFRLPESDFQSINGSRSLIKWKSDSEPLPSNELTTDLNVIRWLSFSLLGVLNM